MNSIILGCFAINLGISNAPVAERIGEKNPIESAQRKGCHHLWLKTNSKLVVLAFKSHNIVPWKFKNRWLNYLSIASLMPFIVSNIYWERNHYANKLTNLGLSITSSIWFDHCLL